jgi:hypothetical protein
MREPGKSHAREHKSLLETPGMLGDNGWNRGPSTPAELAAVKELRLQIQAELQRHVAAFVTTSTLKDQIKRDAATSIYLLGKYLVYLNNQHIQCHAGRAANVSCPGARTNP